MDYEAVIGLEVHAQIHTKSKMFCSCPVVADTGDLPPNTHVCPVCLALPGTLPVVNRSAIEMGVVTGLALNCTINPVNVFSRKSYFYPDLPKGYQISQYDLPLAENGALEVEMAAGTKFIGITRAHLEEDTGKLYHQDDGRAFVDFNRAGVPLLEIVSEPDMHTIEDVQAYATTLRDVLIYLGVNEGDMEKGEMRFEANVSVRLVGTETLGTRTEIKNLNSFRALTASTAYEIKRQIALLEAGGVVIQQTMGWDEVKGETYPQRSKEHAHDYRYFPEPDIPPLELNEAWIEALKAHVPELPLAKKQRLVTQYGIRPYDAGLLVVDRAVADWFETAAELGNAKQIKAQEIVNWLTGELFRILKLENTPIDDCQVTPEHLVGLLLLLAENRINSTAAKQVLVEMAATGEMSDAVVERLGLAQISDVDALVAIVQEVVEANPKQVGQYLDGKTNVVGWFLGQVMRASKGKANPQDARKLLQAALEQKRS